MGSAAPKSLRLRTSDSVSAAPANKSAAMQIAVIKSCECAFIKNEITPKLLKATVEDRVSARSRRISVQFCQRDGNVSQVDNTNFLLDRNIIETIGVSHK